MTKRILLLAITVLLVAFARAETNATFTRTEDVIYGRKAGTALTLAVFQPAKTNGFGIALMVSGGWFSSHEAINPKYFGALLDRGYTV
jgi:hypothetical protein